MLPYVCRSIENERPKQTVEQFWELSKERKIATKSITTIPTIRMVCLFELHLSLFLRFYVSTSFFLSIGDENNILFMDTFMVKTTMIEMGFRIEDVPNTIVCILSSFIHLNNNKVCTLVENMSEKNRFIEIIFDIVSITKFRCYYLNLITENLLRWCEQQTWLSKTISKYLTNNK